MFKFSLLFVYFSDLRLPWLDKTLVKGQLLEIEKWLPPNTALKPFMIDTLSEECYVYIFGSFGKPMDVKEYAEIILAGFKQHGPSVLINYPPQLDTSDQRGLVSVVATRWVFACGSRLFLEKAVQLSQSLNKTNKYYQSTFDFVLDFPGILFFYTRAKKFTANKSDMDLNPFFCFKLYVCY